MTTEAALQKCLDSLIDHQQTLFDTGHTFWHCDAHDTNDKGEYKPFRYYQTNRTVSMSTCGNCQKLMELRKEIRKIEKFLKLPLTPFHTNFTSLDKAKRMSVKDTSPFNPNYNYM